MTPLEIQYSPSSCIPSVDIELQRYRELSDQARTLRHDTTWYGAHPDEHVVVFPASTASAPLHVFIHGGYWQALSAADSLGAAPELVAAGVGYAAINYRLAPEVSIDTMIVECVTALAHVVGVLRPSELTVSGSSAGAHLAAHTAMRTSAAIDRLILLSGVFDLRPLVHTYVNGPLRLTEGSAEALSILTGPAPGGEVLVRHGANETDAFKRQSARLAEVWGVPAVEVAGRNHFDLVTDLAAIHLGAHRVAAARPRGGETNHPPGSGATP